MRRVAAGGAFFLALVVGCGAGGETDGGAQGQRYLVDAAFRRAQLEASLVNPANGYSQLRLAHYATGGGGNREGDWDALPAWNPAVSPVFPGGAVGVFSPLTVTRDAAQLRSLGEAAFFRYPAQLAAFVSPALTSQSALDRAGLWSDAAHGAGGVVSVQFPDGTRGPAITCSTCHARMEGGTLVAGLPNQQLNLGALIGAHAGGSADWGPGRIDVAPPPGEEPIAIPDLRPVALLTHLHRDGTVRNNLIALAIRIETLIITSHGGVIRPPREVSLGLAVYLWSLAPPPLSAMDPGSAAERGVALFEVHCSECHALPGFSGPPVALGTVGTDPRVGLSRDRGTGGYRAPSLRGVASRGRLLHDNAAPDLDALFDPSRLQATSPILGHPFGLNLSASDHADLLSYLRTL